VNDHDTTLREKENILAQKINRLEQDLERADALIAGLEAGYQALKTTISKQNVIIQAEREQHIRYDLLEEENQALRTKNQENQIKTETTKWRNQNAE